MITRVSSILFLVLLLSFSLTAPVSGQDSISNPDMESWINNLTYEDPTGWTTLNPLASVLGVEMAFKANAPSEVRSGNYAAKLVTQVILTDVTPSLLTTGVVNTVTNDIDGGIPIQSRPAVLSGWYQYTPSGTDTALFHIHLTKWNTATNTTDTVGVANMMTSDATTGWTYFELAISYFSGDTPDTVQHLFVSSSNFSPQLNSTLVLDDLSYEVQVDVISLERSSIRIYPNPARDHLYIDSAPRSGGIMSVYNLSGILVLQRELSEYNKPFSIERLPAGAYILEVQHLQRVIFNRKFMKYN